MRSNKLIFSVACQRAGVHLLLANCNSMRALGTHLLPANCGCSAMSVLLSRVKSWRRSRAPSLVLTTSISM